MAEKISVIIPVYNAEQWLREALESLWKQTYRNFEALLVDDGSTDSSSRICQSFCNQDSRFRLICQPNAGVSAARNTGLNVATGRWIAFMDADDKMPPDALSILMKHAKNSKAGIVAGTFARGAKMPKQPQLGMGKSRTINSEEAILMGLYQKRILNNPWGMLYSSNLFKINPPLRFRNCRYEDLDIFYRAFERVEKICLLDHMVYFYRDTPGSFINTWSNARLDVLDVTDRIVRHMQERSSALLRAANDRRFSAHFNMLTEMLKYGIEDNTQITRCLEVIKEERFNELKDPNVRLKNKIGALVSYLGLPVIRVISKYLR